MRWCFLFSLLIPFPALAATHGHPSPTPAAGVAEPNPTTPQGVFAQMGHNFRADRAKGQHLRYQFNFSDPQGGQWWIEINDGAYTLGNGSIKRPDVTFACTGTDWVRLSNGTLGGWEAFFSGRLHVSGNQFTAHKLDEIFP
ncbi:MAG TPA: SCP2 sterol-binding domain-containing protein [Chthoniobacteraceae bacterium]|jgi:putative sterol carrier protein|nr:SCP2 sterol-binding domain-containing protein [Chthoniobacteraceae bacterium]